MRTKHYFPNVVFEVWSNFFVKFVRSIDEIQRKKCIFSMFSSTSGRTTNSLFDNMTLKLFEWNHRELVKSPLNYMGGKFKLLPQIIPYFPKDINTFVDLFAGGCNVGINVISRKVICNDIINYLIDIFKLFKNNTKEESISYINSRIYEYGLTPKNEDGFKLLRNEYNTSHRPLDLFVLIAHSFNYQIRFNSKHIYNTPFGKENSTYNDVMKMNLDQFIDRLHEIDITFTSNDFRDVDLSGLNTDDFVYCDPPYLITTGSYNDGKRGFKGWGDNDEYDLLNLLDNLNERNLRFALSNVLCHKGKTNDILIEWVNVRGYNTYHLKKNYSASSYQTINRNKNASDEVLITNY